MEIILASASPRRKELFSYITADFIVIPSDADESFPDTIPIEKAPEFVAEMKARAIADKYPYDLVIGCDTGVLIDGQMLGKPQNEEEACQMLSLLSGKTHRVITGCVLIKDGKVTSFSGITKVTFYSLSHEEILSYIETGEPFDKAGAYGIQGYGSLLIKEIHGDFFNVVGLPVARLKREIERLSE